MSDLYDLLRRIRGTDAETALLAGHDATSPGDPVPSAVVKEAFGGDEYAASEATKELRDLGLTDADLAASGEITLNNRGRKLAERIRASRTPGADRQDAVQRVLLSALRDAGQSGGNPTKLVAGRRTRSCPGSRPL